MLYVHSLMGDAQPGEADPNGVGRGLPALFEQIAHDSARYHGPYRIDVALPGTLRSVSRRGDRSRARRERRRVPGLELTLTADRAATVEERDDRPARRAQVTAQATTPATQPGRPRAGLASTLPRSTRRRPRLRRATGSGSRCRSRRS